MHRTYSLGGQGCSSTTQGQTVGSEGKTLPKFYSSLAAGHIYSVLFLRSECRSTEYLYCDLCGETVWEQRHREVYLCYHLLFIRVSHWIMPTDMIRNNTRSEQLGAWLHLRTGSLLSQFPQSFLCSSYHKFLKERKSQFRSSQTPIWRTEKNPSRSFTYIVKPREFCFTCGFQCSAVKHCQLTGRKWEVSAEGQTKQSKACFSLRAEGKHSKGKGAEGWNTVHIARMGSGYL